MRCRRLITLSSAVAVVAFALLAAGCGAGDGSSGNHVAQLGSTATNSAGSPDAGGTTNSQLLAFSQCVRSHGVRNFPDSEPGANNAKFPGAQQLGVGNSQLSAAENACQHLLPAGIDDQFPPAEVPLLLRGMVRFSQCMRSHGVPNWPDPTVDSQGRPYFPLSAQGFTRQQAHSSQIAHTMDGCRHRMPSALGGVPTG
jgi:hypothetical protein